MPMPAHMGTPALVAAQVEDAFVEIDMPEDQSPPSFPVPCRHILAFVLGDGEPNRVLPEGEAQDGDLARIPAHPFMQCAAELRSDIGDQGNSRWGNVAEPDWPPVPSLSHRAIFEDDVLEPPIRAGELRVTKRLTGELALSGQLAMSARVEMPTSVVKDVDSVDRPGSDRALSQRHFWEMAASPPVQDGEGGPTLPFVPELNTSDRPQRAVIYDMARIAPAPARESDGSVFPPLAMNKGIGALRTEPYHLGANTFSTSWFDPIEEGLALGLPDALQNMAGVESPSLDTPVRSETASTGAQVPMTFSGRADLGMRIVAQTFHALAQGIEGGKSAQLEIDLGRSDLGKLVLKVQVVNNALHLHVLGGTIDAEVLIRRSMPALMRAFQRADLTEVTLTFGQERLTLSGNRALGHSLGGPWPRVTPTGRLDRRL
ncbi:MAG: hypothetical protein ACK4HW_04125 [Roseinatronobacter sp.]